MITDPYLILGIADNADDAAVHAAYLAAIRAHPPDRDPEQFAAIRTAYEQLQDHKKRLAYDLFTYQAPTADDILNRLAPVDADKRPDQALFAALLRGDD